MPGLHTKVAFCMNSFEAIKASGHLSLKQLKFTFINYVFSRGHCIKMVLWHDHLIQHYQQDVHTAETGQGEELEIYLLKT